MSTTVTVDCCEIPMFETADRHMDLVTWGINRHGQRSNVLKPADGAQKSALMGVFYAHPAFDMASGLGMPQGNDDEGPYVKQRAIYAKDLGIPRGATIEYATLLCKGEPIVILDQGGLGGVGYPPGYQPEGWIYGVLEPNAIIRTTENAVGTGYDAQLQGSHFAQYGYRRRWRQASYPQHQRHTEAIVKFPLYSDRSLNVLPNLAPIIQEIVNQPRWKPDNRICLYPRHGVPWPGFFFEVDRLGWATQTQSIPNTTKSAPTQLSVTYT